MTSEPKPATKPHRLWPRFTLRVFLAVITLLAIGLGWWTHRAREQRRVVQALQRLDAEILYEGWATDAWVPPNVVELFGRDYFDAVSGVTLNQMVSDNDLLPVMQLPHLTVLRVKTGPRQQPLERLTNASLQRLAKLPRLKCLFIDEGRFNKRGFDALDASLSLTAGRVTSMRWVDTSDDPIIVQWRSSHDLGPKKITHYSAK